MDDTMILLVEDNPNDEALTLRALKRNSIKNVITVVRDGVEALEWLFSRGAYKGRDPTDVPKLMLLDLKLPRVSGLEVLRAVRADPKTRRLPVVVLTSSAEEEDIIESYNEGANGYVRKPASFDDFVEAVRSIGLYWLALNETVPVPRWQWH